ncbi:hypothetical protein ACJMK2_033254 [Sinanodonta woodiana]|uniref:Uncharacterized protein n=1 Tax=Sinanodonta woodiana TaxID=1069815 RepID=A0ABD3X6D8_SINWO
MKKFNENFDEYRQATLNSDEHLHFLYCNAHYLLGLSRAAEQTLHEIEKEIGCLGRDTNAKFSRFHKGAENATSRFVRTACDVLGPRGDEKNGVRAEWIAFCSHRSIKSIVTSYRNNRLNNYFEGEAALIHHKSDIVSFLKNGYLGHSNLKLESVAADAEDDRLITLVLAVALTFHNVTGPYWELLQSSIKYADVHVYIHKMTTGLRQLKEDPSDILDKNFTGIFNGKFRQDSPTTDSVYSYFQSLKAESIVILKSALQDLFKSYLQVTERQLCDFLENGKYTELGRSTDMSISHSPLTNLLGERCFGDLDFDLYKRRHSSLHHHSTINMLKRNRTGDWLSSKGTEKSAELMKKA